MIVRPNKTYESNSRFPNSDWYNENNYIIDETTVDGNLLAEKIRNNAPYFNFVLSDNGDLLDVTPTERPPEPPPQPTEIDILGQQLVEKDLQILDLQNENQTIGQQLVDIDLRLLQGGL